MKKKWIEPEPGLSRFKKIVLIMRLTLFLLTIAVFSTNAATYGQTSKLDLNMQNMQIRDILGQIEDQSEYTFMYDNNQVDVLKKVSLDVKASSIETVLDELFKGSGVSYKIINRHIMLYSKNGDMVGSQQSKTISGKVTDSSGAPLPGVSVVVKGTTTGTITDFDGKYTLANVPADATLVFSFVGMKAQEISVAGKSSVNVTMKEETVGIEEVVAVGYGSQKRVNMTGAVSSVNFSEIASSRPLLNVSSSLSGLSPGVTVRQSVGRPGSDEATIRIRGIGTLNNSNPLIIIDGMEGSLDAVNPQDIESISVLKDAASASIYGSRAANGVILITTKKGDNKKLNVLYNGTFSIAQPVNLLDFVCDYPTYMRLVNESARNIGAAEVFSTNTISAWEIANQNPKGLNENGVPNYVSFPNTNWNEEIYENNIIQNHTLSVRGATSNARFLLSAGYLNNPGLVNNTGLEKYLFRSNIEIDINKWLTVGTRFYTDLQDTGLGDYTNLLTYMQVTSPGVYPYYNGKYGFPEAPEESATANNLLLGLNRYKGDDTSLRSNLTLYNKIKITKGLSWNFNFNYSKQFSEYNRHQDQQTTGQTKLSTGEEIIQATSTSNLTTYYSTSSNYKYVLENLLHYETIIGKRHNINSLLGYNETYYFTNNTNATKKGLVDSSIYVFDTATEMVSINGSSADWALRSWFGRINYDFSERYLFEANFRYDGSSRFDSDYRHGLFPSFSLGWRISEENFMKNNKLVQNLKVRASWGKLGNNASGNYDYQATYKTNNYSFNGTQVTGLYSSKIANPELQWESTSVTNLGIDALLINGQLSAEVDVYNKVTDGILTTPPIHYTLGLIGAPTRNTAEVTNKGVEFTLGWKDEIGRIRYSISGNLGWNKNEVTSYKGKLKEGWDAENSIYSSNIGDVSSGSSTRILEDHIINEYYLLEAYQGNENYFNKDGTIDIIGGPKDGMIRTPKDMEWLNAMISAGYKFMPNQTIAKNKIWYGDYIYADRNGDKIYGNSYDTKFTGSSSMPKIIFGSQMNFSWKNFDLALIWSGQAGGKSYWLERGYNSSYVTTGFQIGKMVEKDHYYYNDTNPDDEENNITAQYPRFKLSSDSQNTQASTRWLYNSSFLRLKNLTFGYNIPKQIATRIYAEQIRIYFSAENLLTFTSFPGLDPEMGGNTNYPIIRQIAFGTNITF